MKLPMWPLEASLCDSKNKIEPKKLPPVRVDLETYGFESDAPPRSLHGRTTYHDTGMKNVLYTQVRDERFVNGCDK